MRVLFVAAGVAAAIAGGVVALASADDGTPEQDRPDPTVVDPDHYTVEYENDVVRLVRIRYGPGEESVMHYHPANCAIFFTGGTGQMEFPDGSTETSPMTSRTVACTDEEMHRPSNAGDSPFELMLVELKGRATFE